MEGGVNTILHTWRFVQQTGDQLVTPSCFRAEEEGGEWGGCRWSPPGEEASFALIACCEKL